MTDTAYEAWINANVDPHNNGYGKCREVSEAMASQFPELEVRKGVFRSVAWGDRTHWWCRVSETGRIIDPTAKQHPGANCFPGKAVEAACYDDLTDLTEEEAIRQEKIPVGKCLDCGGPVWASSEYAGQSLCSAGCARAYHAYMTEGLL